MPAGCKMDLPLPKAQPITDGGSFCDNVFRKGGAAGGTTLHVAARGEESEWERETRSVQKGGRRCPRHQSTGSPEAHGIDQDEAGSGPAAHGGPWWSRSPPAASGGPHAEAGGWLKEAVSPWGAHAGAGS